MKTFNTTITLTSQIEAESQESAEAAAKAWVVESELEESCEVSWSVEEAKASEQADTANAGDDEGRSGAQHAEKEDASKAA